MNEKWKFVPVEPTNEMKQAVSDIAGPQALAWALAGWETMVSAAPPPPSGAASPRPALPVEAIHRDGCEHATAPVWLCDCPRPVFALTPAPSYAEGLEAAALWHDVQVVRLEQQIEENDKYKLQVGNMDDGANSFCRDQILTHRCSARDLRFLARKPPAEGGL